MRRILFTALLAATGTICSAQGLESYKGRLAGSDSSSYARVQVIEHGSASQAVRTLRAGVRDDKIKGYRVRIFFDNSQRARSQAAETMARFRELYPAVPVYMSYENPYFKVTVGNCTTKEEAIILKGQIEGSFSRAFITLEDIPMSKLCE